MIFLILLILLLALILFFLKRSVSQNKEMSICSLCLETFPDKSLTLAHELAFCPNDYSLYKNSEWIELRTVISSSQKPELSVEIYENQKQLITNSVPAFIRSSYFEDAEEIKTIFKLYIREQDQIIGKKLIFTFS